MASGQRRPYQGLHGRQWNFLHDLAVLTVTADHLVTRPSEVFLARPRPAQDRHSTKRHQEQGPLNVLAEKSWLSPATPFLNTSTTESASHGSPIGSNAGRNATVLRWLVS